MITQDNKSLIESIVNVFETGSVAGDYGNISIFNDGPGGIKQVTYGRSQTTQYSHLGELLTQYVSNGGQYATNFVGNPALQFPTAANTNADHASVVSATDAPTTPNIFYMKNKDLWKDATFLSDLKLAAKDPIMKKTQDDFFDQAYWQPAYNWFNANKFQQPLSMLVIYDSFIHSGGILSFLRQRFSATPADEKEWTKEYVEARKFWLANHSNPILRKTIYRPECFEKEINRNNWSLNIRPINANGIMV